ncbi:hypothetical protein PF008_g11300 [Phytophthora fragariae]|uniref:Uncharacterized protein n=1 Tax=Phytophthora fragariae TaxID=53985 RepID=A0A6G0RRA6_9STRA|nr:hypothetical protein PF008_g11300 [Phytophthora fragariae]
MRESLLDSLISSMREPLLNRLVDVREQLLNRLIHRRKPVINRLVLHPREPRMPNRLPITCAATGSSSS